MMITLNVTGMTCQHCVHAITEAITAQDAAAKVQVDLEKKTVSAETSLARPQLAAAITEAGYEVH